MAIVFVSPRKRQITFFASIAVFFLFVVIIISLIVFLSKPTVVLEDQVFKKPNIALNLSVLDSNELKALILIDQVQYDFIYEAITDKGKSITGKISALSEDDAISKLEVMKFTNIKASQEPVGRDNPFSIYYQISPTINLIKK